MKSSKYNRSQIMKNALYFMENEVYPTWGECQSAAWKREKLVMKMRQGIARFSFIKKSDGSTRKAIGTLRNGNYTYQSKGTTRKNNPANVRYYDIEKDAFRSFNITSLIAA